MKYKLGDLSRILNDGPFEYGSTWVYPDKATVMNEFVQLEFTVRGTNPISGIEYLICRESDDHGLFSITITYAHKDGYIETNHTHISAEVMKDYFRFIDHILNYVTTKKTQK
jgi:hypothetical protein